jgi:hypothetical protein
MRSGICRPVVPIRDGVAVRLSHRAFLTPPLSKRKC